MIPPRTMARNAAIIFLEGLTGGALSSQLGCHASEPARNTEDVEDLTSSLSLEAVPDSR